MNVYYSFYWNIIFLSKITLIFIKDSQIKINWSANYLHKCSKNTNWLYRLLKSALLEFLWGISDWTVKASRGQKSQAKDLPSDFACSTYRFGWISLWGPPKYSEVPCTCQISKLPYLPGKIARVSVNKVPGPYFQVALFQKVQSLFLKSCVVISEPVCFSQIWHSSQSLGNITNVSCYKENRFLLNLCK